MREGRRRGLRPLLLLLPLLLTAATSASAADGVTGIWLGHDRDGHVEIAPCGKVLCGRIISILDPKVPQDARDVYNESTDKRTRPICGLQVLGGLKKEGDTWGDGWVYDPRRGKTFNVEIWLTNPITLLVKGYMGLKFLSETKTWTRAGNNVPRCARAHS